MTRTQNLMARITAGLALLTVTACAAPDVSRGVNDPFEAQNRVRFEKSINFDRNVLRPVATAYGEAVPEPARRGIHNFSDNFRLPGYVVNDLLQANVDDALHNSARFLFNSTIGLLGILDPMSSAGLTARPSDFGETLHVWGAPQGAYLVAPFVGPTTERDAVGKVVDLFTNPLGFALHKPERYLGTLTAIPSKLDDRYRFAGTVESILYESADPYAAARILYLENRRFALGVVEDDTFVDPYEDPYAQ